MKNILLVCLVCMCVLLGNLVKAKPAADESSTETVQTDDSAKLSATLADMKRIGEAIESYMTDVYHAPMGDLLAVKQEIEPFYIRKMPMKDGWGREWLYSSAGRYSYSYDDVYSLCSAGRDGKFEGFDQDFDLPSDDIIFCNGKFTKVARKK